MIERITAAIRKLIFCRKVTADFLSFIKLVWLTKKYKWSKKHPGKSRTNDLPIKYRLRFGGKKLEVYLRTYSGDIDIFYEVFLNDVYAFPKADTPQMIVDLGANTGLATIYFLLKFPGVKVISVEPLPGNIDVLKKNLAEEILSNKVTVVEAAISDKAGPVFFSNPSLKFNAKIVEQDDDEEKIAVDGINMTALLQQNAIERIDVMKIDIEGAETKLFAGDKSWLKNVKQLVIEFHSAAAHELCAEILLRHKFMIQEHKTKDIDFWVKE